MRLLLIFLLALGALFGQDAGLVLSTYVSYSTSLASSSLPPGKKARLDEMRKQAMALNAKKEYGDALKLLHRGMEEMKGVEWTPALSLASSLEFRVDHAVWEAGREIRVKARRLYAADPGAPEFVMASFRLQAEKLGEAKIPAGGSETAIRVPQIPPGNYNLEVTVPPLPRAKTIAITVQPGLRERIPRLDARIAALKTPPGTALWTAQYATEVFRRVDRGEISATSVDLFREISRGEVLTTALEKGIDPLPPASRDAHLAYLSKVDGTLQPYRLYTPPGYDGTKPFPLVMALHGMGGDENTLFDRYGDHELLKQAAKHGFIVAAPKGREPASMYRGPAEQDVMDVLNQVRSDHKIDPNRIYMMGHSMGGYGTWSIAVHHPDIFAALGPIAGGGDAAGMATIARIPQIVIHGDDDKTVPVTQSRNMVEAGRRAGAEIEYVEIPGGSHTGVAAPSFAQIFDFFAAHSKKATSGASAGSR